MGLPDSSALPLGAGITADPISTPRVPWNHHSSPLAPPQTSQHHHRPSGTTTEPVGTTTDPTGTTTDPISTTTDPPPQIQMVPPQLPGTTTAPQHLGPKNSPPCEEEGPIPQRAAQDSRGCRSSTHKLFTWPIPAARRCQRGTGRQRGQSGLG